MHIIFIALALLLTSCSSTTPTDGGNIPLTPLPQEPIDPSDQILKQAVRDFLGSTEAPGASSYEFSRIDLNSDGRRDALVLFKTPYGYWCGTHGCTMLVFRAHNDHFTLLNAIQPFREPLYISDQTSNGWKDLVVRISGRWDKAKNVTLRFDGKQYPSNPSKLPGQSQYTLSDYLPIFR